MIIIKESETLILCIHLKLFTHWLLYLFFFFTSSSRSFVCRSFGSSHSPKIIQMCSHTTTYRFTLLWRHHVKYVMHTTLFVIDIHRKMFIYIICSWWPIVNQNQCFSQLMQNPYTFRLAAAAAQQTACRHKTQKIHIQPKQSHVDIKNKKYQFVIYNRIQI